MQRFILIAGATGDLGGRVVRELIKRKANVRAIVRAATDPDKVRALQGEGVEVMEVDFNDVGSLTEACRGASCVVSTLAGLREVIVDTQQHLLEAAVNAGVTRFIPSDFSIDFTRLAPGQNRNLDLRREFYEIINRSPIRATSVFNGAFTDMLTGQMPMILFPLKRIFYWGNGDQPMDFTTKDDVAAFTAAAALDDDAPRELHIAGDLISARQLMGVMTKLTGERYRPLRPGGLTAFAQLIKVARFFQPGKDELYPAWQGMQYLHNMLSGKALPEKMDNDRYPRFSWTRAEEVLGRHLKEGTNGQ